MSKIVNQIQNDFTIIPNTILQDTRVSGLAFKIYCYIAFRLGRDKEWEFYNGEILSHFKEGKKAFSNAKKQLLEYGYLVILGQNHNNDGSFAGNDYAIYAEPQNSPCSQKGNTLKGNTLQGNTLKGYTNKKDINKKEINKNEINKEKDTASGFSSSQSNYSEIPNNSAVKESLTTQKQDAEQGYILNSSKKNGDHGRSEKEKCELKTKQEVKEFVKDFKAQEFIVDGTLQKQPIFTEREVDLITEYILRRKECYKSKVKSTSQALTGLLNNILEVRGEISLETIFKQEEGCYVNCGTAGDKTKPYQTITLDNRFKHLIQKTTFNNQNDNTALNRAQAFQQQLRSLKTSSVETFIDDEFIDFK